MFRVFCGPDAWRPHDVSLAQPLPPVPIDPFPKDGLAISGGVPLEPIETVSPTSPEWAAHGRRAARGVRRVEDETIATCAAMRRWRHPIPAGQRRTICQSASSRGIARRRANRGGPCRTWKPSGSIRPARRQGLRPRNVRQRLGAPPRRQADDKTQLTARLTYCDRVGVTLHAAVRPHSAEQDRPTGCFSSPAGRPSGTRSWRSVRRGPLRARSVRGRRHRGCR